MSSFITQKLGIEDHCYTSIPVAPTPPPPPTSAAAAAAAPPPPGPPSTTPTVHSRIASVTAPSQLTAAAAASSDIFAQLGSMDTSDSRRLAGFDPRIFNDQQVREACIPSCNTHFSAFGLATIYAALANDGSVHGRRVLSAEYVARLKRDVEKAPHQKETWPMGFRKFRHEGRPKVGAFGFNGISNLAGLADPATNTAMAVMVNQVSPNPVATASLLAEITSEMKGGGALVWPGY